jgi:hypothetical protein
MVPDYCGQHGNCTDLRLAENEGVVERNDKGWCLRIEERRLPIRNCPWCGWQLPRPFNRGIKDENVQHKHGSVL